MVSSASQVQRKLHGLFSWAAHGCRCSNLRQISERKSSEKANHSCLKTAAGEYLTSTAEPAGCLWWTISSQSSLWCMMSLIGYSWGCKLLWRSAGRVLGRRRRPGVRRSSTDAGKDKAANYRRPFLARPAITEYSPRRPHMWEMNRRRNYP